MLHVILSLRADQTFRSLVVFKSLGRFLQHLSRFYLGNHMRVHRFIEDELLRAWSYQWRYLLCFTCDGFEDHRIKMTSRFQYNVSRL